MNPTFSIDRVAPPFSGSQVVRISIQGSDGRLYHIDFPPETMEAVADAMRKCRSGALGNHGILGKPGPDAKPYISIDRIEHPFVKVQSMRISAMTDPGNQTWIDVPIVIVSELAEAMELAAKGPLGNYGLISKSETTP